MSSTKTSVFGFTNTTDSTHVITPKALGLTDNYAVTSDTSNAAILNNKTAPIDLEEAISFRSDDIKSLKVNGVNIQYPSPVTQGIQYSVQVTDTLSTTDSSDASFRVDEPIQVTISVRHPKSGNINNDVVATVVTRAISALVKADGTWRFDDLMRGAERPVTD
jgi:hypothetical protein